MARWGWTACWQAPYLLSCNISSGNNHLVEEYLGACWSSCRLKQVCDASKSISAALASSLSFRQMFWVQPSQPSAKLRSACLGWFSSSSRCFFCPYDVIRRLEWSPSPSGLWMLDDLLWFFEMLPVISYLRTQTQWHNPSKFIINLRCLGGFTICEKPSGLELWRFTPERGRQGFHMSRMALCVQC